MSAYLITPLIGTVVALILGLFVLIKRIDSPINQIFSLFCFETFFWQVCWLVSYFLIGSFSKELIVRIAFSVIIFIPFTYYHFAIIFLNLSPQKNRVRAAYIFGIIFFILLWTSDLFISSYRDFWWGYYPRVGPLFFIYLIGVFFCMLRALALIFNGLRNSLDGLEKNKIRYMALGHFLYSFATIEYAIDYGFPIYPIGAFFIFCAWIVIAYAITKAHLMDITVIVGRTAAYVTTIILLGVCYLLLTLAYVNLFSSKVGIGFFGMTVVYGILVGEFFQRVRFFIQTTAEKKFLKSRYDYRKILSRMSEKLTGCKTMEDITRVLEGDFKEEVEAKSVRVYLVKGG